MKVNYVMLVFGLLLGFLTAYSFYASGMEIARTVFVGIMSLLYFEAFLAFSFPDNPRGSMLMKVTGVSSFVVLVVLNIILSVADAGNTLFFILNSFMFIISALVIYKLVSIKL